MAITLIRILAVVVAFAALSSAGEQPEPPRPLLGGRSLLHAHNCYPDEGRWSNRIERALATGQSRIAIEQDLAWLPGAAGRPGRSVVSHDEELAGSEPSLEDHFFARVRPLMEQALASNRRDQWPLLILHLDFKTNEPEHHRAVWDMLNRHRAWLTTAEQTADRGRVMPFAIGPLLVLTENGAGQEDDFSNRVPAGERLLIFGTTPSPELLRSEDPAVRARIAATATPSALTPWPATNYRRWTNFAWQVVEEGGPARAGDWTAGEQARLASIVKHAHERGLWVRFYTLNGHAEAANQGWTASYSFGSLAGAQLRWRAAIDAGVDFIATDQYEELARLLSNARR